MKALKTLLLIYGILGVQWHSLPASSDPLAQPVEGSAPRFAAIHFAPTPNDFEKNKARLTNLIIQASQRGARYVVVPELSLIRTITSHQPVRSQPQVVAEPVPGPTTEHFGKYAKELGVWLAIPLLEKQGAGGSYYLTTILFNDKGEIISKYRKILVRTGKVHRLAERGDYRDITDTIYDNGLRIGILSGDDIRVGVPRLAERGADTVLISARWSKRDAIDWDELCRQLSKQYSVNLVIANCRDAGGAESVGLSGIYTREGEHIPDTGRGDEIVISSLYTKRLGYNMPPPLGLPSIPVPTYRPSTPDIAELGRLLFTDKNLSSTGKISCSSCHQPEKAFTNGETRGVGVYQRRTKRNVPSLLNVAFRPLLQWDGYASSLENFSKYPLSGFNEMDFHYLDKVVAYLRAQPHYVRAFSSAMGVEEIQFEHVAQALATYQRTLVSGNSPFDRYYYGGDQSALSDSEKRGLEYFMGRGECSKCHVIGDEYALFMDLKSSCDRRRLRPGARRIQ